MRIHLSQEDTRLTLAILLIIALIGSGLLMMQRPVTAHAAATVMAPTNARYVNELCGGTGHCRWGGTITSGCCV